MNAVQLAAHAGITYRQVDQWSNAGLLQPRNQGAGIRATSGLPTG